MQLSPPPQVAWEGSPKHTNKMDPETFSTFSDDSILNNNPKNKAWMSAKNTFSGEDLLLEMAENLN